MQGRPKRNHIYKFVRLAFTDADEREQIMRYIKGISAGRSDGQTIRDIIIDHMIIKERIGK